MQLINEYRVVESLEEAYTLLQKKTNAIVAGNQWLRLARTRIGTAIDLSGLGLDKIEETEEGFVIGAMVSLRELETSESLNSCFDGTFKEALKPIVGVQFRNTATVGGSVYGRFGFSDVLTLLLSLETEVELYREGRVPLVDFEARTAHERDILTHIIIHKDNAGHIYQSVRRQATDFPVLAHAVSYDKADGRLVVAVGARPAKAKRVECTALNLPEDTAGIVTDLVGREMNFGSNLRGSAGYRRKLAAVLTGRAVERLRND